MVKIAILRRSYQEPCGALPLLLHRDAVNSHTTAPSMYFRTAEDEKHGDYLKITWCFYEDFVKSRVVVSS